MEGVKLSPDHGAMQLFGLKNSNLAESETAINTDYLELYCLYRIAATLSKTMDIDDTLKVVKHLFQKTFALDSYSLFLLDKNQQKLNLQSRFGLQELSRAKQSYGFDENIFNAAFKDGRALYIRDLDSDRDKYASFSALYVKPGSLLCLPLLRDSTETAIGMVQLYRMETDAFTRQEINLFEKLSQQLASVLDKVLLYKQTRALSVTDELTGIANRRYFKQSFEREILRSQRYNRPLSVIILDIDHFKSFNDTHGHLLGDEVLRDFARLLEVNLRSADLAARFGGEEFVVLLPEIDKQHARKVAEKLREAIESHHFKSEHTQPLGKITASLGVASYPEDASQGMELLEAADRMLYMAKSMGRNQVAYVGSEARVSEDEPAEFHYVAAKE